ncbi:hypothetical protein HYW43_00550 [Candidatus Daviesbacteria bacterium]|nr:hypothetical protein [Candidatus Daviesbacteria bacterium]
MIKKRKIFNGLLIIIFTLSIINLILMLKRAEFSPLYNLSEAKIANPAYIVIFASLIYLLWAFAYHKIDKSLTFSIYMEYVLTALLSIILLMGVLL